MNLDQALRLLGMLTDTVAQQAAQIDALSAALAAAQTTTEEEPS